MNKGKRNIAQNSVAKNSIILYFRMFLVTVVSFYTSRITLDILGVEDYGIQNVVGSLVSFMGIITATMSSATQRFLSFELGKGNITKYRETFSMLLQIYFILSIAVVFIAEILGPWIITKYLVIPEERIYAARWVYQCSLFIFVCSMLTTPYMASIIAYEKMNIYAYMSFYDVFFKLLILYVLYIIPYDKLITISLLQAGVHLLGIIIYRIYCRFNLEGCRYKFYWNLSLLKTMLSYIGWNLFGSVSGTLNSAGTNVILNLYFGPKTNAAKGIADRVNQIISQFGSNFFLAITPQIVKKYAIGEVSESLKLVYLSSKYSFFLLYIIALPLIIFMQPILLLWLGNNNVSDEMVLFCRLILILSWINILEQPLTQIMRATGNIKRYQLYVGLLTLTTIPFSSIFLHLGFPSYFAILSIIIVYTLAHIIRLIITRNQVGLNIMTYLKIVLIPIMKVVLISLLLNGFILYFFKEFLESYYIICIITTIILIFFVILFIGLSKDERFFIYKKIIGKLKKVDIVCKN